MYKRVFILQLWNMEVAVSWLCKEDHDSGSKWQSFEAADQLIDFWQKTCINNSRAVYDSEVYSA